MNRLLASLTCAFALAGCGYVGDPLPPALNIPLAVSDLKAGQRAATIYVDFTIPSLTTEQLGIRQLGSVDLRVGLAGQSPEDLKTYPVDKLTPGAVKVEIPSAEWAGKEIVVAVRLGNLRGRYSEWSNLSQVRVVAPLSPPSDVIALSHPEGVRIAWNTMAGARYRVYRTAEGDQAPILVASVPGGEYLDRAVTLGKPYRYALQTFIDTVESDRSNPISITPEDRFAPSAPVGLTAIGAISTGELSWERNTEADLGGYRVYRSVDGGPFERQSPDPDAPAWSDKAMSRGKLYRYVVTAVDQAGNESPRSAPGELKAP